MLSVLFSHCEQTIFKLSVCFWNNHFLRLTESRKTNKRLEISFFSLLKVVTRGVLKMASRKQKAFHGLRLSISQWFLDTITEPNKMRENYLSSYQPDNEVWTQPRKVVEIVEKSTSHWNLDTNWRAEKSGGLRIQRNGQQCFSSVSGTFIRFLQSAVCGNWKRSLFFAW